jgi:hypothetical protein
MTETFRKLNYKAQRPILVFNAPDSFQSELDVMEAAEIHRKPTRGRTYDFVLAFAAMKSDLLMAAEAIKPFIATDAILWFAYPKQTSKAFTSDLNRDECRATLARLGFETVRQIAIDADWSALRYKRTA